MVSLFSMALVFLVLVILSLVIILFSRIFGAARGSRQVSVRPAEDMQVQPSSLNGKHAVPDMSAGTLKLYKVDEKTAAMIMAIVSHESDIPLSELCFKSIKLIEEND